MNTGCLPPEFLPDNGCANPETLRMCEIRVSRSSEVSAALEVNILIRVLSRRASRSSDVPSALVTASCRACLVDLPMFDFLGGISNNFRYLMVGNR